MLNIVQRKVWFIKLPIKTITDSIKKHRLKKRKTLCEKEKQIGGSKPCDFISNNRWFFHYVQRKCVVINVSSQN